METPIGASTQATSQLSTTIPTFLGGLLLVTTMYAYYDREADIAWLPTGKAERVVSEEVEWGLIDHDATTDEIVAVEIWAASRRLPQAVLDALPRPGKHPGIAA